MAATLSRLALFGLLPLAAACADERPRAGEIALNEAFRADFDLVDQTGAPATDERFEGEPMLIYFGFASCPDVCPTALGVMSASLDALGRRADEIQPLFISVDPERDTPERLSQYLAFDPRILGLTGDEEALREAREAMKVFAAKVPLQDSAMGYTVDHQSMFFLTDASGQPVVALDDAMAPEDIAAVISRYL
ncbi:SCO family protein [Parvularcula oceani]|uniref:SCO family protein n=1 Tax=Parvularcula oceani TaxID=1247963 RepID=UPI00068CD7BE|nr:SCO family protein [Parvularcula oceani]